MTKKKVELFDTTCRDGSQDPKANISISDKYLLIPLIDKFGADFIEVNYALGSRDENKLYSDLGSKLKNSKLVAFGSTANPKNLKTPQNDAGLGAITETGAKYACIFGKTWNVHIREQLKITPEENLALITKSVEYLKSKGLEVIYDAEHFFSEFFKDSDYAMKTLKAAIKGGAGRIVLCDTKGGAMPRDIRSAVLRIRKEFGNQKNIIWGFHGHGDSECAVANTVEFVDGMLEYSDTVHVQGTFNGIGERTGNAAINIVAANLHFKYGHELSLIDFKKLTPISREVADITRKYLDVQTSYVGRYAFAHKGGVHIHGARQGATYNHIDPRLVGNEEIYLISNQSGRDAMVWFAQKFGHPLEKTSPKIAKLLKIAKRITTEGYDLNISDAVGELFMRDFYEKKSRLINFPSYITSTVKLKKKKYGETDLKEGYVIDKKGKKQKIKSFRLKSGGGPVDSQFKVIKKVVGRYYPEITGIDMVFYEEDIPPLKNGGKDYSSSKVLTIIGFTDGVQRWTTIGLDASSNVASFEAIVSGMEYIIPKYINKK